MNQQSLSLDRELEILKGALKSMRPRGWSSLQQNEIFKGSRKGERVATQSIAFMKEEDGVVLRMTSINLCRYALGGSITRMAERLIGESLVGEEGYEIDFLRIQRGKRKCLGIGVVAYVHVSNLDRYDSEDIARFLEERISLVSWISRELAVCNDKYRS